MSQKIKRLLKEADIEINGQRPWDIQVKNDKLFKRVLSQGSLGFGEAYMDGWWDSKSVDELMSKILSANLEKKFKHNLAFLLPAMGARIFNLQSTGRAFKIGQAHYDKGNDLYKTMLDQRMVYTCGYWKEAHNLDDAQEAKLDLVCRKIGLQKGQRVLDIGCGWGSFAKFAAEKYGAEVVGITVSQEQVDLARELTKGLPVEIRLQDYREVNEKFDHIISLGMIEHVGYKNYRTYMEVVNKNLKDKGLFLLHTIGTGVSTTSTDPWIAKYIFPNSMLPSIKQLSSAFEKLLVVEDWHNFGADYDKTLLAWFKNFDTGWVGLKDRYSERFYRMWKFYLLTSAGSFRARKNQLWQIVLSKNGIPGGYQSIR